MREVTRLVFDAQDIKQIEDLVEATLVRVLTRFGFAEGPAASAAASPAPVVTRYTERGYPIETVPIPAPPAPPEAPTARPPAPVPPPVVQAPVASPEAPETPQEFLAGLVSEDAEPPALPRAASGNGQHQQPAVEPPAPPPFGRHIERPEPPKPPKKAKPPKPERKPGTPLGDFLKHVQDWPTGFVPCNEAATTLSEKGYRFESAVVLVNGWVREQSVPAVIVHNIPTKMRPTQGCRGGRVMVDKQQVLRKYDQYRVGADAWRTRIHA